MRKHIKNQSGILFNLKKPEYAQGAGFALSNAKEFIEVAELCRDSKLYAKGVPNLVFALEELCKAAYLQLKALNPHIVIKNLDEYFRKHAVKHIGIIQLVSAVEQVKDKDSGKPLTKSLTKEEGIGIGIVILLVIFVIFVLAQKSDSDSTTVDKSDSLGWPSNGQTFHEFFRQAGLYVEFDEGNRRWLNPADVIDEEVFSMLYEQATKSLDAVNEMFSDDIDAVTAIFIADKLNDENIITKDARKQLETDPAQFIRRKAIQIQNDLTMNLGEANTDEATSTTSA